MKRGGAVKKRGGGMMGPKKKMAKGGTAGTRKKALARAKARKPSGRLTADDIKRALERYTPSQKAGGSKGRSAAAKKAAMKGVDVLRGSRLKSIIASINKGKGNPAGKDLSMRGAMRRSGASLLAKLRKAKGKKK